MSGALGSFDEFALEGIVHDRDDAGVVYETLYERLPDHQEAFYLVKFMDENEPRIVQGNTGAGERYVIEAEIKPHENTDCHSLAECIQDALDGTGLTVVHECGSKRYYLVSQLEVDQ